MSAIAWLPPPVGFTDDAMLQAWVKDLHEHILAAGLVQTEDAGQIDPETVTVALTASNNLVGCLIYRFDDDLQGETPIFLKIELYAGMENTRLILNSAVSVGAGTDGAGALTGIVSSRFLNYVRVYASYANGASKTPQTISKVCFNAERGFFGLVFCPANYSTSNSYPSFFFSPLVCFISRTQAPDGTPTGQGFSLRGRWHDVALYANYNTNGVNFDNVTAMFSQTLGDIASNYTQYAFPYLPIPGVVDGELLALRAYHVFDNAKPIPDYNLVAAPIAQTLGGQEFEMVSGGTEAHNFITLETAAALKPLVVNNLYTPAMLWE